MKRTTPRLAIFNHKGGVGKTTLTVNLAFAFAERGARVLLVDSDPQCNLTSYLIEGSVVNDLLDHSDEKNGKTLWSSLKPLVDASGDARSVEPIELADRISLIPGDIRLAEFEAELPSFWGDCFQRRPRGFRGTTGLSGLVSQQVERHKYDFVFYDTGPNIGALNRVILLDCDYFLVPAACDLFSIRAMKALGHTLANWITQWQTILDLAPDKLYRFDGQPWPIGYVPQRFRVYGGRPSGAYADMLPMVERAMNEDVIGVLRDIDPHLVTAAVPPLRLAEVKDFGSLANAAQNQGLPLWRANAGTDEQRNEARATFAELADKVVNRTKLGT